VSTSPAEPGGALQQGTLREAPGTSVGEVPLKVVTGRQLTTGLNFDLKPGAVVAHESARVVFVCG